MSKSNRNPVAKFSYVNKAATHTNRKTASKGGYSKHKKGAYVC